jgi:hypothetical protein
LRFPVTYATRCRISSRPRTVPAPAKTESFTDTAREALSGAARPYGAKADTDDDIGTRRTSNRLTSITLALGVVRG